ncbi:hypothetical protein VLL09_04905 [Dehalococcoides mccartyi]|uniref:Uncharacterized protein n=1 Tax=Dehalococcoides mccartyi TaxID=61435 RepID=A0AB38Z8A1_9CHLR|nr:hypothetical protein [Dehalococcoides mccartyi]WRO06732.1 hypothetical protein VLL09_04905 [Dehalococcoides mccartyi]
MQMESDWIRMLVQSLADPEVRRRIDKLKEITISIGKREGWVHDGMTREQAVKVVLAKMDAEQKVKKDNIAKKEEDVPPIYNQSPRMKEIRIRLSWEEWEQIAEEAHKLHTTHNSLVQKWILDGLNQTKGSCNQSQLKG